MKIYSSLGIKGNGLLDVGELSSSYYRYSYLLDKYSLFYLLAFMIDVDVCVLLRDEL